MINLFTPQSTIRSILENPFSASLVPKNVKQTPEKTLEETWENPEESMAMLWRFNDAIVRFGEGNQDTLLLWETPPLFNPEFGGRPYLDPYLLNHPAPVVVVVPGGGYQAIAIGHEGNQIGTAFNEAGFHAVVLRYRVAPNRFPVPQMDLIRAIKLVRANANQWQIIPDQLAVCGFSAGGHLTASIGGLHDQIELPEDEYAHISAKPNALILSYAVLSFKTWAHQGSVNALLGENNTPEMREQLSCETMVSPAYPPAFIWTCGDDTAVPIQNSQMMAKACNQAGVPHELHIYPGGAHGVGLGHGLEAEAWFEQSVHFLKRSFNRADPIPCPLQ